MMYGNHEPIRTTGIMTNALVARRLCCCTGSACLSHCSERNSMALIPNPHAGSDNPGPSDGDFSLLDGSALPHVSRLPLCMIEVDHTPCDVDIDFDLADRSQPADSHRPDDPAAKGATV